MKNGSSRFFASTEFDLVDAAVPPKGTTMLLFARYRRVLREADLPPFVPCEEASERRVVTRAELEGGGLALAFPLHQKAALQFFAKA